MHTIYTTPGFVISARPYGEAGKVISIFTRDFGLVTAIAAGIREEKSKLRYHVQEYSLGDYSLVRGKEFWRLTSSTADRSYPRNELMARIALLLRRFLHGEEANEALYSCISNAAEFISDNDLSTDELDALESLTVLRMLNTLGYVGNSDEVALFIGDDDLSKEALASVSATRKSLNKHINTALNESQL